MTERWILRAGWAAALVVASLLMLSVARAQPATLAQEATVELYGMVSDNGPLCATENRGNALSDLYRIDPETGASALIGATGFRGISGIDFHPTTGVLYGVGRRPSDDEAFLLTVNPSSGNASTIGSGINDEDFQRVPDMSFRSDGTLFAWDENVDELATINVSTGVMTTFGDGISGFGHGMEFVGNSLLLSQGSSLVVLNQATGDISSTIGALAPLPSGFLAANSMAVHPGTGELYGVISPTDCDDTRTFLIKISTTTAAITVVGPTPNGLDAIAFRLVAGEEGRRNFPNIGGAVGAIAGAAGQQAAENRARANQQATPVATAAVRPPSTGTGVSISPPNTGEAGLADSRSRVPYLAAVALLAGSGLLTLMAARQKR